MALHPDDPPVLNLRGLGRVLINGDAFRRVHEIFPSSHNGITFCQATFKAMGEDVAALAREFASRIFFVHLRDIRGTRDAFVETFHDNGPTDMGAMLKIYRDIGFNGPVRPDHTPEITGENSEIKGYGIQGRLFAVGYLKGLAEGLGMPFE